MPKPDEGAPHAVTCQGDEVLVAESRADRSSFLERRRCRRRIAFDRCAKGRRTQQVAPLHHVQPMFVQQAEPRDSHPAAGARLPCNSAWKPSQKAQRTAPAMLPWERKSWRARAQIAAVALLPVR